LARTRENAATDSVREGMNTCLNEYISASITSTLLKCGDRKVLVILAEDHPNPRINRPAKKTVVADKIRIILFVLAVHPFVRQYTIREAMKITDGRIWLRNKAIAETKDLIGNRVFSLKQKYRARIKKKFPIAFS